MSINISNRRIIMTPALASGASSFTTFDPAFLNTNNSLSNGNLTVTCTASANAIARSIASHTTGKYYWEYTVGAAGNFIVGICSSTEVDTTFISSDGKSAGDFAASGWLGVGLTGTVTAPAPNTVGFTYGIALDATNKLIWIKDLSTPGTWNANGTADPATGVNGCNFSGSTDLGTAAIYAAVTCANSGDNATFNFGATAYVGTPPSGFGNM